MNIETIPPPKLRITAIMPRIPETPNEPGPPVLTALMPTAPPMIPHTRVTSGRILATRTNIFLELVVTNAHAKKHKAVNADKIQAPVINTRAASYFPAVPCFAIVRSRLVQENWRNEGSKQSKEVVRGWGWSGEGVACSCLTKSPKIRERVHPGIDWLHTFANSRRKFTYSCALVFISPFCRWLPWSLFLFR